MSHLAVAARVFEPKLHGIWPVTGLPRTEKEIIMHGRNILATKSTYSISLSMDVDGKERSTDGVPIVAILFACRSDLVLDVVPFHD